LIYLTLPLEDSEKQRIDPYFDASYEFIKQALEKGGKVLVHW